MPIAANWNAWRKIMQPIGFATRRCGRSISSDLLALDLCAWGACFCPMCSRSIFAPQPRVLLSDLLALDLCASAARAFVFPPKGGISIDVLALDLCA